jgi:hypothetical protein
MQIGDNVRVRSNARRAGIIEDHGHSRYRVLICSDAAAETPQDEYDGGGVYDAVDLDVIPDCRRIKAYWRENHQTYRGMIVGGYSDILAYKFGYPPFEINQLDGRGPAHAMTHSLYVKLRDQSRRRTYQSKFCRCQYAERATPPSTP